MAALRTAVSGACNRSIERMAVYSWAWNKRKKIKRIEYPGKWIYSHKGINLLKKPWVLFVGVTEKTFPFLGIGLNRIVRPAWYELSQPINSSCCLFLPEFWEDPIQGIPPVIRGSLHFMLSAIDFLFWKSFQNKPFPVLKYLIAVYWCFQQFFKWFHENK